MTRDYGRLLLLCALALTVPPSVRAQERVGVEFQVNSYTTGNQGTSYGSDHPAVGVTPMATSSSPGPSKGSPIVEFSRLAFVDQSNDSFG